MIATYMADFISIHALVKRATQAVSAGVMITHYFNPRPREEGDGKLVHLFSNFGISIHALVKRATPYGVVIYPSSVISIHALVKRATKPQSDGTLLAQISIHALVKRATTCLCSPRAIDVYFNPRPREEGDS